MTCNPIWSLCLTLVIYKKQQLLLPSTNSDTACVFLTWQSTSSSHTQLAGIQEEFPHWNSLGAQEDREHSTSSELSPQSSSPLHTKFLEMQRPLAQVNSLGAQVMFPAAAIRWLTLRCACVVLHILYFCQSDYNSSAQVYCHLPDLLSNRRVMSRRVSTWATGGRLPLIRPLCNLFVLCLFTVYICDCAQQPCSQHHKQLSNMTAEGQWRHRSVLFDFAAEFIDE